VGKYRLLGSAVLVYALLTSGALLSVALGWPGAVNGALWLVYVLGGLGLIFGKGWGRALTLLAAGGSLIAMVALSIAAGVELFYFSTVWILGGLPALAILVSALLVKLPPSQEVEVPPPTGAAQAPRISRRARHDIAYISFMVLGLISFWTSYFIYSEIQAAGGQTGGVDGVLGFLVIIPFGIPLLFALILGPGLSVFLWRDFRLMTLTVLTIALLIALGDLGYKTWPMLLSLYAAGCMTIGTIWFIRYRRHFG
jgi:hypothetical protein